MSIWARHASPVKNTLLHVAARHGTPLQSQCYLKMRNAHFTGESGFAPTELVSNNLYT